VRSANWNYPEFRQAEGATPRTSIRNGAQQPERERVPEAVRRVAPPDDGAAEQELEPPLGLTHGNRHKSWSHKALRIEQNGMNAAPCLLREIPQRSTPSDWNDLSWPPTLR